MNPVYKSIAKFAVKSLMKKLAVKTGMKWLFGGFIGGLITPFLVYFVAFAIGEGAFKIDEIILEKINKKDKEAFLDLVSKGQVGNTMTEEEKEVYKKTFLQKLTSVLSIKKFLRGKKK